MKIVRFGKAGKMVCIGSGNRGEDTWYSISDAVRPHLEKLAEGTEVTIKADKIKGTDTLLQIYPVGAAPSNGNGHAAAAAPAPSAAKTSYGKSPAEQDSIKRQAIGNMTSRGLIALQGMVTPDNIEEVAEKLYAKFSNLVG